MNDPKKKSVRATELSTGGFIARIVGALLLVLATYNPTDRSFVGWVRTAVTEGTLGPEHFFVGMVILIGWTILVVATFRSLGTLGLILGAGFFATLVWLLIDFGILSAESAESVTWIVEICLAMLLAIGLSWSHVWRRVTGQFEVNDDD